jgi:hypothetical protein
MNYVKCSPARKCGRKFHHKLPRIANQSTVGIHKVRSMWSLLDKKLFRNVGSCQRESDEINVLAATLHSCDYTPCDFHVWGLFIEEELKVNILRTVLEVSNRELLCFNISQFSMCAYACVFTWNNSTCT